MISVDVIPLAVAARARQLLRESGQTNVSVSHRSGIALRSIGELSAPRSRAANCRATAVRYLRFVRGLPARLTTEECAEVHSMLASFAALGRGRGAAVARALGLSHQRVSEVLAGCRPSVLLWAALFPAAIGCEDIITSPIAAARAA